MTGKHIRAAEGRPSAMDRPISAEERHEAVEKISAARRAKGDPSGYYSGVEHDKFWAGVKWQKAQPVTDEMVERANAAFWRSADNCDDHGDPMREALEAALKETP